VTDARYTYTAGMPAARVGWLVARARAVAGIADRDLASSLGVPLRMVRRWERGDLVPTDDEVESIAAACGTRLTELLPRRASVSYDRATGIMKMGDQAVAMPGSMHDNDTVLGAYVAMVRRHRGLRPDQDIKVRQEDLEALGEALDLEDDELEERLVRVIGISRTQAAAVRAQLLRRRLAVPMVGMLAGLSLLGINRIFTTATEQVKTVAGGSVTRGNPFATTTTSSTVFGLPIVVTTAATTPAPTSPPATDALPPVVTAEPFVGPPPTNVRTGPPRTPRTDETDPAPTDPPATDPVTTPETAAPTTPFVTEPPTTPPTQP
jgi:transcriptional regulator with XRE-family HTH domain